MRAYNIHRKSTRFTKAAVMLALYSRKESITILKEAKALNKTGNA